MEAVGFVLSTSSVGGSTQWTAKREDLALVGDSPLQLLGLYGVRKERGSAWKASDAEIEAFLKQFPHA